MRDLDLPTLQLFAAVCEQRSISRVSKQAYLVGSAISKRLAQLEDAENIAKKRRKVTAVYQELYAPYEKKGYLTIPHPPASAALNGHAFFVVFDAPENRERFLAQLREKDVYAYIGYVPLHSSTMGQKLGCRPEDLPLTENLAKRVVRLPLYADLADNGLGYCIDAMNSVLQNIYGK